MTTILLAVFLGAILFWLLYDIYQTRRFNQRRQIVPALIGAVILVYILYTCTSDH